MSMAEAAKWLGVKGRDPGRWLRRYLLRLEKRLERPILVRGAGSGGKYWVSPAALRRFTPELIDPTNEIAKALREMTRTQKRGLEELSEKIEDIQFQQAVILRAIKDKLRR